MAFPGTYNYNYYRGDSLEFVVRPKTSNGAPFNLSGYTAEFYLANRRGALGTQTVASAIVDEEINVVTCTISPTVGRTLAAGTYVYDIQITNGTQVYTILTGSVTVTDDITGAVV